MKAKHRTGAEQRVADFVKHRAGAITCRDAGGLVQPLSAARGLYAKAEVAAAPGQVEGELGLVAGIDAEGGVAAVERTVEELAAVLDDEVLAVRGVPEGTIDVAGEVGLRLGNGGQRILPERMGEDNDGQQKEQGDWRVASEGHADSLL